MPFLFVSAVLAQKPFQNGQAARAVVGQLTFTKGDQNPTGQILGGASGIAWAGNRLYVADSNRIGATPNNDRVLVFDTTLIPGLHTDITQDTAVQTLTSCFVCGTPAMISLGQNSFTPPTYIPSTQSTPIVTFYNGINGTQDPSGSNPSENAWLYDATAVASDGVRFAIADTDNNRVLLWNSVPNGNAHPDLVVGQPDFNTVQKQQLGVVTATSMRGPQGVWIANNRLYVADTQDYRVLIWNSWPTKNNQAPDVVLGQPDFTHANAPPPSTTNPTAAANQLLNPVAVTADAGHVFVADLGFNRVLIWNTTSPGMDQNADVVVGQLDFSQSAANNSTVCAQNDPQNSGNNLGTGTQGQCRASLNYPRFALSDGTRLFIADGGNDRVLIFNTIPTSNGVLADGILGQTNFTNDIVTSVSISIVSTEVDNTGGVDTTPTPTSLAWDGSNLYVSDPYNRRILVFTPGDILIPSAFDISASFVPIVNWASEIVRQEGTVTFAVTTGGKITAGDTAVITIAGTAYTYTEKSTDTPDTIAKGLVALINKSDPNVTANFGGGGSGTVYVSSISKSGAESVSLGYDSLSLATSASNVNNVTAVASGSYLSAGNAATASPGTLVEVNAPPGVTFTDTNTTYVAPMNGPTVPNTVNGVQLYIDGFASPLYKVTPTQLVGQIPYTYGDRNSSSIYVRTVHNGGSITATNATPVYIAPANPGIFDQQQYPDQSRPWPIALARHQLNNPTTVISVDGTATANDTVSIFVNGSSTPYTYTVTSTDTSATSPLASVVSGLVNLMQSDPYVVPSAGGSFTRLVLTARQDGFSGGNGIPIAVATGTTSGGIASCSITNTAATETLTPYGSTGTDANCHATVNTCCAVQNGSLIYPANPAVPGELISIYTAGMGGIQDGSGNDITSTIVTGAPYTGPAPPTSINDVLSPNFVAATLGAQTAQVIFAGLDTGSYGIYRTDLLIPSGAATNSATPLYIAQNAFISNTVTVPVGPAVSSPAPPLPIVPANPITSVIDNPALQPTGSTITVGGVLAIYGWAVDAATSIASVQIQIDGVTVGTAAYGAARPDVCAVLPGRLGCPNVGFTYNLDTTGIPNGDHTLNILVTNASGAHHTNPTSVAITVDNVPYYPTHVAIDTPSAAGQVYHGLTMFAGWALNTSSKITSLTGYLDGTPLNPSQFVKNQSRPDVCAVLPSPDGCNVGWSYLVDLNSVPNSLNINGTLQTHSFTVIAKAADGQQFSASATFFVNNYAAYTSYAGPTVSIDAPSASAGTLSGTTQLWGWALDPVVTISYVQASVDGVVIGNIPYGNNRADVCTAYIPTYFSALPGCTISGSTTTAYTFSAASLGFSGTLDTTQFADGPHTLAVTAYPAQGQAFTLTRQITVGNVDTTANPVKVTIDVPTQAALTMTNLSGTAVVYGWTLTNDSSSVQSVQVSVDGVPNGAATYGVPRPDVCAVYSGRPGCPNVGWSYSLDTTRLSNGQHMLEVTTTTTAGKRATRGAPFSVSNSSTTEMVAIDAPGDRSFPYSGIVTAAGWAVKTGQAIVSVTASVDGVPNGTAVYGALRPDVCAVFPGRPGCPNVGWTYLFDTEWLVDGPHAFSVTATAADGTAYTASSNFTVANWTATQVMNGVIDTPTALAFTPYYTGQQTFHGWFLEPNVTMQSAMVTVDGVPYGSVNVHVARPDVCAVLSSPDCPNTGWTFSIDTSLLTNDLHTFAITATTSAGQSATFSQEFVTQN